MNPEEDNLEKKKIKGTFMLKKGTIVIPLSFAPEESSIQADAPIPTEIDWFFNGYFQIEDIFDPNANVVKVAKMQKEEMTIVMFPTASEHAILTGRYYMGMIVSKHTIIPIDSF